MCWPLPVSIQFLQWTSYIPYLGFWYVTFFWVFILTWFIFYEARTILRLAVSRCRTRVVSDTTPTHNYTELCDFLKFLVVSVCLCHVRCSYPCFIVYISWGIETFLMCFFVSGFVEWWMFHVLASHVVFCFFY